MLTHINWYCGSSNKTEEALTSLDQSLILVIFVFLVFPVTLLHFYSVSR